MERSEVYAHVAKSAYLYSFGVRRNCVRRGARQRDAVSFRGNGGGMKIAPEIGMQSTAEPPSPEARQWLR